MYLLDERSILVDRVDAVEDGVRLSPERCERVRGVHRDETDLSTSQVLSPQPRGEVSSELHVYGSANSFYITKTNHFRSFHPLFFLSFSSPSLGLSK